jgi:hypothetical protein
MVGSKTTKKSVSRKGPSQSAKLFDIGTKKRGNNGKIWEIASFNGVKRWIISSSKKRTPKKEIHHNSINKQNNKLIKSKNDSLKRKGPDSSATNYDIGTKKRGNDGRQWIVIKSSNGVKRWVPVVVDVDAIKYKNNTITFFDVGKVIPKLKNGKIKKIGSLDITSSKIGIGELLFNDYPTKKGRYNIYYYDGSLIAVHYNEFIEDQIFQLTTGSADCDMGMFSFNDSKRVRPYVKSSKRKRKKIFFPEFDMDVLLPDKKTFYDYAYVYESDLEINKDNYDVVDKNPIAIFAQNKFGDGSFPIYKGKNAYWIMSENTHSKMFNLVNNL